MAAPSLRCFETTAYLGCRCTTHFGMENLSWLSVPICSCSVIFLWKKLHHSGWETLKWRPRVTKDRATLKAGTVERRNGGMAEWQNGGMAENDPKS